MEKETVKKNVDETGAAELPKTEVKTVEPKASGTSASGEYKEGNIEFMRSMNPGMEINDENYVSSMESTLANVAPRIKNYDEASNNLKAMIYDNPKLGMVLTDMSKGDKFESAFPRHFDISSLEPKPGDPNHDAWEAATIERKAAYDSHVAEQKAIDENITKSEQVIEEWFDKKGYDDAAKTAFGTFVIGLLERAYKGEITEEFLNKMDKAMNHEDEVQKAAEAGEIKGRNEKIVAEKMNDEELKKGDGLADLTGGGEAQEAVEAKPDNADRLTRGLRQLTSKRPLLGRGL